jgi:hypothetical protein
MTSQNPFDKINQVLSEYNKFRNPEVTVKFLHFEDGKLTIQFEGPFCNTCDFYDYFEDFIYEMKRLNKLEMDIDDIKENGSQKFVVIYSISKRSSL